MIIEILEMTEKGLPLRIKYQGKEFWHYTKLSSELRVSPSNLCRNTYKKNVNHIRVHSLYVDVEDFLDKLNYA